MSEYASWTPEYASRPLNELVDDILVVPWGVPVREMEAVLARGEEAVEPVVAGLREALADEIEWLNPMWPVVLLGELGAPDAARVLADVLRASGPDEIVLPQTAAEALAKIGPSALPTLRRLLDEEEEPFRRVWAYGTVGWIRDDAAYALLTDALSADREMTDVVAMALADQGREDAIPLLAEALREAEPWQRMEVEEAIQWLHRGEAAPLELERDWRLRYRPDPGLGVPSLTWPAMAAVARGSGELERREPVPVRPVEEIVAEVREEEEDEVCESCGEPRVPGTGVPVCPETALKVALLQHRMLGVRGEEKATDDLFYLLDEADLESWELLHAGPPRSRSAGEWREDRKAELRLLRGACQWLIERGVERVGRGRALLLAEATRLAARHGDPEGLLSRVGRPAAASADVGRNDPCPCGSGRKYKKCCGDPARRTGGSPAPDQLELRTLDGETLSIARAHYRVTDPDAVREALARSPEFKHDPGNDAFIWTGEGDAEMGRVLGQVEIEGDRLVLWCLSEGRLARGKELLEEAAGRWLDHRADTSEDPFQAARE